jgi:phage terminase large subunit
MNSLDESSMAEIKAAILSEEWLADHYDIGEKFIRTRDRRIEYDFIGLRHNLDSVKSKARIKLLWVDEAEPSPKWPGRRRSPASARKTPRSG